MANAVQKIKQTPKGIFEWVNITGEGKENLSGKMQYVANLVLDPEEAASAAFLESVNEFWEVNKPPKFNKDPKSTGVYPHTVKSDETDENGDPVYVETGKVVVAFKTGTAYNDGKTKVIKTFNSKAKEVQLGETKIGNGSMGRIAGAMGIYTNTNKQGKVMDAGVTMYLDSVMITKLVEFSVGPEFEADEDEDGFEGDEGWTGSDEAATPAATPKTSGPRL